MSTYPNSIIFYEWGKLSVTFVTGILVGCRNGVCQSCQQKGCHFVTLSPNPLSINVYRGFVGDRIGDNYNKSVTTNRPRQNIIKG